MQSHHTDQQRDVELERYEVLRRHQARDLQALVELVAQVCQVPTAAINIVTRHQQHQIATAGIDPGVCSREDSMCAVVMDELRPVIVPDASLDPRFADNAFVTGAIASVRFYASAPIITPDGVPLGRLCVFDDAPRVLTQEQELALTTLAAQVMDVLVLRYRSRALEESLAELTVAQEDLRRSNHHLELFAGQVSHDLRSPLTAILANAEMLSGEPAIAADGELKAITEAMIDAGQRMNRMIEEMLGFALEGGRLHLSTTRLDDVVHQVLDDLAPSIAQADAQVVVHDLPAVMANADMLYSVVLNLVTNALKFVRPGVAPRIELTAIRTPDGWRFTISDNGIGIPPTRREAVFALFSRGSAEVEGHGIGLATTRRLVEAHGGRVGVEESSSGGAAVWFELPRPG